MHVVPARQEKAKEFKFRLVKLELSPLEQELGGVISGNPTFVSYLSSQRAACSVVFHLEVKKRTWKERMERRKKQGRS